MVVPRRTTVQGAMELLVHKVAAAEVGVVQGLTMAAMEAILGAAEVQAVLVVTVEMAQMAESEFTHGR